MKYVITGGAGNISKPLTLALLKAGHAVSVIGRDASRLKELTDAGATVAVGSVEDINFLKQAFAGADAVYTMVPPKYDIAADWKGFIGQIGANYAAAIKANAIRYVVNLSSIGAHTVDGCGPVSGLHKVEERLNELADTNIRHLRPGYFYSNFLGNVAMVKHMKIIGNNFGGGDFKLVLSDPGDIARAAEEELLLLNFKGHSARYLASDERTTDDIARTIGMAIGMPALPWVVFPNEQAFEGMKQAGLPEELSKNYAEMGNAFQTGIMSEDYWKNRPLSFGNTKLEDFAKKFAAVYSGN